MDTRKPFSKFGLLRYPSAIAVGIAYSLRQIHFVTAMKSPDESRFGPGTFPRFPIESDVDGGLFMRF